MGTTIADGYAPIGIKDASFRSRPCTARCGSASARSRSTCCSRSAISSALRKHIGYRTWRALHWSAYATWPLALAHGLGSGSDARYGWMAVLAVACLVLVVGSVAVRLYQSRTPALQVLAGAATLGLVVLLGSWYAAGRASAGGRRGRARPSRCSSRRRRRPCRRGSWRRSGSSSRSPASPGSSSATCRRPAPTSTATRPSRSRWRSAVALPGSSSSRSGAARSRTAGSRMSKSEVSFEDARTGTVYHGVVVGLQGNLRRRRRDVARLDAPPDDAAPDRRRDESVTGLSRRRRVSEGAGVGMSAAADRLAAAPRGLPRLLAGLGGASHAPALEAHLERYGVPPRLGRELIPLAEESGLTGRGGARFPTGRKLAAVASRGGRPTVVVNAVEGEPASGKDRALVRTVPHLVLDGAVLAAEASAPARRSSPSAAPRRSSSPRSRGDRRRARRRLDGRVRLRAVAAPDAFVARRGERTRPLPRGRPGEADVRRAARTSAATSSRTSRRSPTSRSSPASARRGSVSSVTRRRARHGAGHAHGRRGDARRLRDRLGTPLEDLLTQAGGPTEPLRAVLIGGYFGTWLDASTARGLRLLDATSFPHRASLGARAVVALRRAPAAWSKRRASPTTWRARAPASAALASTG